VPLRDSERSEVGHQVGLFRGGEVRGPYRPRDSIAMKVAQATEGQEPTSPVTAETHRLRCLISKRYHWPHSTLHWAAVVQCETVQVHQT